MNRLLRICAAAVALFGTLFIINQTAQIVSLAATLHPGFGKAVLVALLAAYGMGAFLGARAVLRLPKPLAPPPEDSPEYPAFLTALGARLAANPHLGGQRCPDRAAIEEAIAVLDRRADELTRSMAHGIFVSTAVSQSGRLDACLLLAAQLRLVWSIAHLYWQRPALRDMLSLYRNVATTAFLAEGLEDLDIAEHVEPVIRAAFGSSVVALVPGAGPAASYLMQSILQGTANAYLTLRIGTLSRYYCGAVTAVDARTARRNAAVHAAGMLASIVTSSAAGVVSAILSAVKRAGGTTIQTAAAGLREWTDLLNPFRFI